MPHSAPARAPLARSFTGGLRPAGPPYAVARGDPKCPTPLRRARPWRAQSPGGFAPPDPYAVARGDPECPLRSGARALGAPALVRGSEQDIALGA